jgi:hypothetical protein
MRRFIIFALIAGGLVILSGTFVGLSLDKKVNPLVASIYVYADSVVCLTEKDVARFSALSRPARNRISSGVATHGVFCREMDEIVGISRGVYKRTLIGNTLYEWDALLVQYEGKERLVYVMRKVADGVYNT